MNKVRELIDALVMNEVQRKTCATLSPNMREYLGWMLEVDREEDSLEQVCSVILRCVLRTYTRVRAVARSMRIAVFNLN